MVPPTKRLNDGAEIPTLGFGTWHVPDGDPVRKAVSCALSTGYRHLDTASEYGNEAGVGQAIRRSSVPREELWVTTKLWVSDLVRGRVRQALEESLQRLGLEYIDLYLIHWPIPGFIARGWEQMQEARELGLCRSIGVSNFALPQLRRVVASEVVPAINQIHISPFFSRPADRRAIYPFLWNERVLGFCREEGITTTAYSPLRPPQLEGEHLILASLAHKYVRTPQQILLRWSQQEGHVVLTRSQNVKHIAENFQLDFEIDPIDLELLKGARSADPHLTAPKRRRSRDEAVAGAAVPGPSLRD